MSFGIWLAYAHSCSPACILILFQDINLDTKPPSWSSTCRTLLGLSSLRMSRDLRFHPLAHTLSTHWACVATTFKNSCWVPTRFVEYDMPQTLDLSERNSPCSFVLMSFKYFLIKYKHLVVYISSNLVGCFSLASPTRAVGTSLWLPLPRTPSQPRHQQLFSHQFLHVFTTRAVRLSSHGSFPLPVICLLSFSSCFYSLFVRFHSGTLL